MPAAPVPGTAKAPPTSHFSGFPRLSTCWPPALPRSCLDVIRQPAQPPRSRGTGVSRTTQGHSPQRIGSSAKPALVLTLAWSIGAVVARFVHTEEVTGSSPVSTTSISPSRVARGGLLHFPATHSQTKCPSALRGWDVRPSRRGIIRITAYAPPAAPIEPTGSCEQ